MDEDAEFQDIIVVGILGLLVSVLIFLLLEVIFAQILTDFIINKYESEDNLILFLILLGGFLLGMVIGVIAGILAGESYLNRFDIMKSSITAFIANIILWVIYALIRIITTYPGIEINWSQIFIVFPRILIYYSIYFLENVPFFFILVQITYFILLVVFLILFKAQRKL